MVTPYYLTLPPTYGPDGLLVVLGPESPLYDTRMCSICRAYVNNYNQGEHNQFHNELEAVQQAVTRMTVCEECHAVVLAENKDAHLLYHAYVDGELEYAQRQVPATQPTPVPGSGPSLQDLLDGFTDKTWKAM